MIGQGNLLLCISSLASLMMSLEFSSTHNFVIPIYKEEMSFMAKASYAASFFDREKSS